MTDDGTATVTPIPSTSLRLRAETAEDLVVFSAVLQDAVTITDDMAYRPVERRFVLMLNRFVWEEDAEGNRESLHRIRCGLHFDGVLSVRSRDLAPTAKDHPLDLLAVHSETLTDGSDVIYLLFAGGGAVRLEVECIDSYLSDIGEPWVCKLRPHHRDSELA
ncbi:DUF2948 family protein [Govanella unica]|uniref:DUF2948 family protein n=1 Tax=Govanella unica TaxID=2975056 RepID=A0A9X3TZF4_9PROT|nr:DUF2948 family protein [Govania unica]MDA5194517.1 DUF2948 family protein [Govania unica]